MHIHPDPGVIKAALFDARLKELWSDDRVNAEPGAFYTTYAQNTKTFVGEPIGLVTDLA